MTPSFCSPVRMQMTELVRSLVIGILLHGSSGTPRHDGTLDSWRLTVGGYTPDFVHSRPNAAIVFGCASRNCEPRRLDSSSSKSSGVGGPVRVRMRCLRSA